MGIYQRGENWYIDFWYKGQRVRESIGPSRKSAEKIIAKKKTEIVENKYLDVRKDLDPVTFHDFCKEYLQWARANHKLRSWARDVSIFRTLEKGLGNKNLHEITTWEIERFKVRRKGEVKPATVNREVASLKAMLSRAVEWGKLKETPGRRVKMLKGEVKRLRFLMPGEIQKLLSSCCEHLLPIVTVAVHTGMRKSEVLELKWDQINFDRGFISLVDTKNQERREIPMNETVRAVLEQIERRGEYVFPGNVPGKPLVAIAKSFADAMEKSGIEDFRFHDLRHTFASNLIMAGEDLNTVRELLGHKDLKMTLRYAHLAPSHKSRAVNTLDRVMSQFSPQEEIEEKKVVEFKRK